MRRRVFNFASFVSLSLSMLCIWFIGCSIDDLRTGNGGIYWNSANGQWLPVSPQEIRVGLYVWLAVLPALAAIPIIWLRRFMRGILQTNRLWRGCCAACGYDLRFATQRCPECGNQVEFPSGAAANNLRQMPPGTQRGFKLLAIVPAAAVLAAILLFVIACAALDFGDGV